jgi:hypothetical protein
MGTSEGFGKSGGVSTAAADHAPGVEVLDVVGLMHFLVRAGNVPRLWECVARSVVHM